MCQWLRTACPYRTPAPCAMRHAGTGTELGGAAGSLGALVPHAARTLCRRSRTGPPANPRRALRLACSTIAVNTRNTTWFRLREAFRD